MNIDFSTLQEVSAFGKTVNEVCLNGRTVWQRFKISFLPRGIDVWQNYSYDDISASQGDTGILNYRDAKYPQTVLEPFMSNKWLSSQVSGNNSISVIRQVNIKDRNIDTIGEKSFLFCSELSSVDIPDVKTINRTAFMDCRRLVSVGSPSLQKIDDFAFTRCSMLSQLDVSNVDYIGKYGFDRCHSIQSLELSGISSIGTCAFRDCMSLSSIVIPEDNQYYTTQDSGSILMTKDKTQVLWGSIPCATDVSLPDSVLSICEYSFAYCTKLKTFEAPGQKYIGEYAFWYCPNLSSVECPDVDSIGIRAFNYCSNLNSIILSSRTSETIPDLNSTNAFDGLPQDYRIIVPSRMYNSWINATNWTLISSHIVSEDAIFLRTPDNGTQNFSYNDVSVYQGDTGTLNYRSSISPYGVIEPFQSNEYLSSDITGNDNISNVVGLTVRDDGVSTIGNYSFYYCQNLSSVDCPNVKSIQSFAFAYCSNLADFRCPDVISVGNRALRNCAVLSSVDISNATFIDTNAFYSCQNLVSIELPNVGYIGSAVFSNCFSLSSVYCPQVHTLGEKSFNRCYELKSIELPNISAIDNRGVFVECVSLSSIVIPEDNQYYTTQDSGSILMTKDGTQVLWGSIPFATDLSLSDSISIIGRYAFSYCSRLSSIQCKNVKTINGGAFQNCTKLQSIELPNIESILDGAFSGCSGLSTIDCSRRKHNTVPVLNNVNAFSGLPADYRILVPESLYDSWINATNWSLISSHIVPVSMISMLASNNEIQNFDYDEITASQGDTGIINYRSSVSPYDVIEPFQSNEYLSSDITGSNNISNVYDVVIPDSRISAIGDYSFFRCRYLSSVECSNVISIGNDAFRNCTGLVCVDLPNVLSVGSTSFYYCQSMTDVELPKTEVIGNYAFQYCSGISSVYIPVVKSIGTHSFSYCRNISSIECPDVDSIGGRAFYECSSLNTIILSSRTSDTIPNLNSTNAFDGLPEDYRIMVPSRLYDTWIRATNWTLISSHIITTNTISFKSSNNGTYDFSYDEISSSQGDTGTLNYRKQISPYNVIEPFQSNEYLSSDITGQNEISNVYGIQIQNSSISAIGNYAFYMCSSLSSVSVPNVMYIGKRAFDNCNGLTSISCPKVKNLGDHSFYGCSSLTSIYLPEVETINGYSLQGCTGLSVIDCPQVTAIGDYAFSIGSSLQDINISNVVLLQKGALWGCYNISSVYIPKATLIDQYAFCNCSSVVSVECPMVNYIGSYAFTRCYSLSVLDFSDKTDSEIPTLDNINAFNVLPSEYIIKVPPSLYDDWVNATNWSLISSHIYCGERDILFGSSQNTIERYNVEQLQNDNVPLNVLQFRNSENRTVELPFSKNHYLSAEVLTKEDRVSSLTSVNDSEGHILSVGQHSLIMCSELREVNLPAVEEIGLGGIAFNTKLSSIDISNVKNIGKSALYASNIFDCLNLPNIENIGDYAFGYCNHNLSVFLLSQDTPPVLGTQSFVGMNRYSVWVKDEAYKSYLTSNNWSDITSHISTLTQPNVTFLCGDYQFPVQKLNYGMSAEAPVVSRPYYDFIGWDGDYNDVISDITCNAIFSKRIMDSDNTTIEMSNHIATGSSDEFVHVCDEINPIVRYTKDGVTTVLNNSEDYVLSYTNNITDWRSLSIGQLCSQTAQVIITGTGYYEGQLSTNFIISYYRNDDQKVTVTFDPCGGDIPSEPQEILYTVGDSYGLCSDFHTLDTTTSKAGYDFLGWFGKGSSTRVLSSDQITSTEAYTLSAHWEIKKFGISAYCEPYDFGTINTESVFISNDINYGTEIQLSAIPFSGYRFIKWSDDTTVSPKNIIMDGDKEISALFHTISTDFSIWSRPALGGRTYRGDNSIEYGEIRQISAVPNSGYEFVKWTPYKGNFEIQDQYSPVTMISSDTLSGAIIIYADFQELS